MDNNSNTQSNIKHFQQIVLTAKNKEQVLKRNMSLLEKATTLWQRDSSHTKIIQLQRILYILKMYTLSRTTEQLDVVKGYFEENFNYYSKFKEKLDQESCRSLFREMTLEWYDSMKTIFRHGDSGRKMYFVLQGELVILIPKSKTSEEQEPLKKQKFHSFDEYINYVFVDYTAVAIKQEGDQFGEIAIEQKTTRTATVISKTEVVLAVITYDLYQRILGAFQHEMTNKKIAFITNIPLFNNWQRQHQLVLLQSLEIQSKQSGQHVYQRGKLDDYIYLVIQGEIEIIQFSVENQNKQFNLHKPPKQSIMAIISNGQFFGDWEHFKQLNERITIATAKTDSTYYRIKYKQLVDYFSIYSTIDDLYKFLTLKFKIQSNLSLKTEESNEFDQTYKFNLNQIKDSYYKKIKVEQQINKLRKKMEKTVEQAQKAIYYYEIEELKQSIEDFETLQADKYSFLVPFKYNPYVNEMNLIRSDTRSTKSREHHNTASNFDSVPNMFKLSIKPKEIQKTIYTGPTSYSRIMQCKLQRLHLNSTSNLTSTLPETTKSQYFKPDQIHNVGLNCAPLRKRQHTQQCYKFQAQK